MKINWMVEVNNCIKIYTKNMGFKEITDLHF